MPPDFQDVLRQGIEAAKSGDRRKASRLFRRATEMNPDDIRGWLYWAHVTPNAREAERALVKALVLEPHNQRAQQMLATVTCRNEKPSSSRSIYRFLLVVVLAITLAGVVLLYLLLFSNKDEHSHITLATAPTNAPASTPTSAPTNTPSFTPTDTPTTVPTSTPTEMVIISDTFKQQLMRLLEQSSTLNAMTSQGVNYVTYRDQLAEVRGIHDFTSTLWPSRFRTDAKDELDKALEGWDLVLYLWQLDIGDKDNPVEPNINGYQLFIDYADGLLHMETHPSYFIVPEYRNKRYLPFDENIGILMAIAGDHFEGARAILLDTLEGHLGMVAPPTPVPSPVQAHG